MITGERRGVRRGMTVLGKVPAVPRPINLPSQRLENRGLDPNVEIVPRGTVTWGNASRSPPTNGGNWGTGSQPSSPPVSAGAWGTKPASAWGPNSARPSSAGSTRPASAGGSSSSGGPRPSSSGGRQAQDLPRPSSAGNQDVPPQNAWGTGNSRPSSASGPPVAGQVPGSRPRSAESSRPNGRVSLLSSELSGPPAQPWGPGAARKPPEDSSQSSRFTLSTGDFPSLGSEKNPNLRPQQRERSEHSDDRSDERPRTGYSDSYQYDGYPQGSRFNDGESANVWARGPGPFRGPPNMQEGGYGVPSNSWRREPPHDHPEGEEHWPPNGPPYAGPPRFPNPEFLPQRFGPGPVPYGRGGHDGYPPPQFMRPMNPERPGPQFGPGMFSGPYDGYYGYPGYNMDERDMMMWAGPGYGGFHPDFPRHSMGPRPRHMPNHPGFGKDGEGFHSDFRPGGKVKDGADGHPDFRREQPNKHAEPKRPLRPHGRDWGNDEPMDFSRPVFEKDTPPSKNHKVSFKAEPATDVAILKKPQPVIKDEEAAGDASRSDDSTRPAAKETEKDVAEEKAPSEMTAGVLGKAPSQPFSEEASPRGNRHSADGSKTSADPKDVKPKGKVSIPESDKEWRPKPHVSSQDSVDADNASDAYDYEAQRAKMKEIAAQRARQIQKEEEERTKEQKAKANAKLEELNRRSAAVSTDAPAPVAPEEKSEPAQKESDYIPETQFGTYHPADLSQEVKAPVPKRSDRKGNRSREERVRVQQKKDLNIPPPASTDEEARVLPSPVLSAPDEVQDAQPQLQPLPGPHKQPRQRGGHRAKQQHARQMAKLEAGKSEAAADQVLEPRPADASLESDSPDVRSASTPPVETTAGNGTSGNRRRKVGRNPKNRHKNEATAPTQGLEKSSSGEILSPAQQPVDTSRAPEISSHSEGGESTTVEPADSLLPEERGSSRASSGRKFQRRFTSKRSAKPQDVRVSDKSHAAEELRWAPVRNVRNEISPDSNGEKNEGQVSSPRQPKSRRAEMERYTPKPVKQQGHVPNAEENDGHGKQARGTDGQQQQLGGEGFHKPGRAWRQRPESSNSVRGHGPPDRQRENGMVYQQKSGGGRPFQDTEGAPPQRFQQQQQQQGGNSHRPFSGDKAQYHPQALKSQAGSSESWSAKGDGGDSKEFRGRESRRGRFGGGRGGGPRTVVDMGVRVEKQRMVIDATGGAVPNQVVG